MLHTLNWRVKVVAALLILYVVWGSTYLAIRIGVIELPPLLFAGARFVLAGLIMTAFALWQGHQLPQSRKDWKVIIIVGGLLLLGGNGLVVWSEQWIPSNQTALIVSVSALLIAWFGSLGPNGHKVRISTRVALVFGFAGVIGLLIPEHDYSTEYMWAQVTVLLATVFWAAGSVYSKRNRINTSSMMSAAMQMLFSGIMFCILGFSMGEQHQWVWSTNAIGSVLYLAILGSCLAYSAYHWLIHEVTPSVLGTYAYINPVVAVLLGWLILDETLSGTQFVSMLIIVSSVIVVTMYQNRKK